MYSFMPCHCPLTGSRQSLRFGTNLIPAYLSPGDWTGGLLKNCFDNIDLISEHFYVQEAPGLMGHVALVPTYTEPYEKLYETVRAACTIAKRRPTNTDHSPVPG